ncbi:MAG: isocitrate/isopropylmalate dehydrogenase family protein, partial [candidate division Zixibacteria bacterium]|nr:isocitrate/isopropylmalate dehydrogenase family protein [candidate division Zixibacteria bacterium]
GVEIEWEQFPAGINAIPDYGSPVPEQLLDSIRRNKVALKGPLTTFVAKGFSSANVGLRKKLDLYANLRPVHSLEGVKARYENVDLVIVRENTEDLYSGIEHLVAPGVSEAIKVITTLASTRIGRFAFEYARKMRRKRVTAVHKANIMKLSDGLFLDSIAAVAEDYPDIRFDDVIVDALCMKLVMDPTQFDILVLSNLYGDIVSDLAAGLVGGLGMVPGANIGTEYAVFEAVHGSAPDIAGKGIANPCALVFSGILMLRHLHEDAAADKIMNAVRQVIRDGRVLTRDLGGNATTKEFAYAVISYMQRNLSGVFAVSVS